MIKRIITDDEAVKIDNRSKLKKKIKDELAKTSPDLTKCIKWLAKQVFGEAE